MVRHSLLVMNGNSQWDIPERQLHKSLYLCIFGFKVHAPMLSERSKPATINQSLIGGLSKVLVEKLTSL